MVSVAAGTAAVGRGRLCAMDTVFNGSTLGIEQHVVEVAPVGSRLVLDNSINSTIYRVLLPLSPYAACSWRRRVWCVLDGLRGPRQIHGCLLLHP